MDINKVKILVLTVDCWSNRVGANTMSSLFSWCKPENIANVYIRPEIPTYDGCNNYFQIRENDVIKSIIQRNTITGRCVYANEVPDDNNLDVEKNRYRKYREHRPWMLLYAREILWTLGKWKSKEFKDFVIEFSPDVIVFAYEGLLHFNRLVRYAINTTGAKSIGYFWDDNFTYKQQPRNLGYCIYRLFQKNSIKKTVALSSLNFAISPKTKKECDQVFGIDSVLLTKPMGEKIPTFEANKEVHEPIQILYTGNLGIGRYDTLKIIANVVNNLNAGKNRITINVYTNTFISDNEKNILGKNVTINDPVSQDNVLELQKKADILLFIEDIIGKNREIARLSFSTKLTDYFSAGKCILAVAAADIAPIEYLRENDAALIATTEEEIYLQLDSVLNNPELLNVYAYKSYCTGNKNHSYQLIIKKMQDAIKSVVKESRLYESVAD